MLNIISLEACERNSVLDTDYQLLSVVTTLNHFANITLSSFYFDITKDCLYADDVNSHQRRAVVTVLEQACISSDTWSIVANMQRQVLKTMTSIIAPIAPHLAEEVYYTCQGAKGSKGEGLSAFTQPWETMVRKPEALYYHRNVHSYLGLGECVGRRTSCARHGKLASGSQCC